MTELLMKAGKPILIVLLILLVTALSFVFGIHRGKFSAVPPQLRSTGPTVTQLEHIGELSAIRVHVTDVLYADGEGYRGSWLISGDGILSCDMAKAKLFDIDPEARTATIQLPPIRVTSARVNHERTKTWSVEKSTWLPWKWGDQGVMRDAAMLHAQILIESAAGSEQHLGPAKSQAELLIRQMYDFVEWNVTIEWE